MTPEEAISKMVPPSTRRPGKWMEGVMQIHLTRACDLACSNCTQGSQFAGKNTFMTPDNFDLACHSLKDYFGLIGIFGGNPALHPQFNTICEILRSHFPQEKCGIWCNHPRGKAAEMRRTFNPAMSNLNVHMVQEAYTEFKRDWPESRPFGLAKDSRHSPVHGNPAVFIQDEGERWKRISECDINRHWSAMICQFRGELRGFFCEVAGGQAMLHQDDPNYPDTGAQVVCPQYMTENDKHTADWKCATCRGVEWWQHRIEAYSDQIQHHCTKCLVPLRGHGALAHTQSQTTITTEYDHLRPKGAHILQIIGQDDSLHPETSRRVIDYLEK